MAALLLCGAAFPQRDWTTHKDPSGFTVQLPPAWSASADRATGRISFTGSGRQSLAIWPVFVAQPLDQRSAGAVLMRLARVSGAPQPAGPGAVRLISRAGDTASLAVLAWQSSPQGSAAWLYTATAPQSAFRETEPVFARILSSFRLLGAASPPGAAALQYARWQDPRENAFSLELPAGWRIQGGLFRFAPVDTRGAWEATAPDGSVRISGGDAALPTFTEPNPLLAMGGFREGSWYSPGYGVRMLVRRYLPGAAFAREYAGTGAAQTCAGIRITENRERPDATAALNGIYAQYPVPGMASQITAGEAAFTCTQQGRPVQGYYFAGTHLIRTAGMPGGLWFAEFLYGYVAAEGQSALAQEALNHALRSLQVNPQWAGMQQNIAANTSRIVSRAQSEISNIISSTYQNRQNVMDELSRRRSNAILGVVDVLDPETGRQIKVENSANYYWIDNRGRIAGTQTDTRPNLDFRALVQLP